jgi:hypothetical protein
MTDWMTDIISRLYWKVVRFLGHKLASDWPLVRRNINLIAPANKALTKQALLYYKTEPFVMPWKVRDYRHTNLWEIVEIVHILNRYGYVVDVVDRDAKHFAPKDVYDLFLGLGAGHSGKRFSQYAKKMPRAAKILIAAGPEPRLSNKLVQEQYARFNARHSCEIPAMRLTEGIDFESFAADTDYFMSIGEQHTFCPQSYMALGKPVLNYLPSTSPAIRFLPEWLETRSRRAFLCFAGDGFICKGVDVVVDAFAAMPDVEVYVCGPRSEPAFFEVLKGKLATSPNIRYEGFIKIGGPRFEELAAHCSYVVFPSSAEGCATSIATVLRVGLLPVVTRETGIDVGQFGIYIDGEKENLVDETMCACRKAIQISDAEYRQRVWGCLKDSSKYTQASFTDSFEKAILTVLSRQGIY